MVVHQLSRVAEFAEVCPQELHAFARRVNVLCIPAGRWLLQRGRVLDAHCYLLRGRLETFAPRRVRTANRLGALKHFYPGVTGARTLTACQILRMENTHRDFLLSTSDAVLSPTSAEGWLANFLGSQMMADLPVSAWQALLAGFERQIYAAKVPIVSFGEDADCCFVIEQGHAVVHRETQTLCHLGPGDFFGEDALILGGRRNAQVTSLEPLVVHRIERDAFYRLLLRRLVQPVEAPGVGQRLCLDSGAPVNGTPVQLASLREQARRLDPRGTYFVVGGRINERYLCAFLLIQRGMRASPVVKISQ